jgi:four helix bundle protein
MSDPEKQQVTSYKDLIVWQKSIVLVRRIYQITARFPADERFGLMSQMRRAAISIPSNIAEGQARRTTPDFIRFISNSEGSAAELDTQLIISIDLGFCSQEDARECFSLIDEIRKMLNALRRSLSLKA